MIEVLVRFELDDSILTGVASDAAAAALLAELEAGIGLETGAGGICELVDGAPLAFTWHLQAHRTAP